VKKDTINRRFEMAGNIYARQMKHLALSLVVGIRIAHGGDIHLTRWENEKSWCLMTVHSQTHYTILLGRKETMPPKSLIVQTQRCVLIRNLFRIAICIFLVGLLSLLFFQRTVRADNDSEFETTLNYLKKIPYNPRPTATDTQDVTGISERDSRNNFLATFTRVTFPAPANGKTFSSSDPSNQPDVTLVGYLRLQTGSLGIPLADRPGIILTHGDVGGGTSVSTSLIHMANVFFANGYHVLLFDRRDGLLTRCGYVEDPPGSGIFVPDPNTSQAWRVGGSATEDCSNLGTAFRRRQAEANFVADTLFTGRGEVTPVFWTAC
jgi:hypothetical protein